MSPSRSKRSQPGRPSRFQVEPGIVHACLRNATKVPNRCGVEAGGRAFSCLGTKVADPEPEPLLATPHQRRWELLWSTVLGVVEKRLLTPVGLRSLAPSDLDYHAKYYGDLRARDAAYHQGTTWAWLIGPLIEAWCKVHPDKRQDSRQFLAGFIHHMDEACIGSISEIFDAEEPYTPRGCIAQAWSVAEVLRCCALHPPRPWRLYSPT